jgi:DNA-binding PadR family transcriptional regulator
LYGLALTSGFIDKTEMRRYYRSTDLGQETLRDAQVKLNELVSEVL